MQSAARVVLEVAFGLAFVAVCAAYCFVPLLYEPEPALWRFLLEWDDEGNFVSNELLSAPLSWATWRQMLVAERINVREPLSWALKSVVRFMPGDVALASAHADAHRQRLASFALHVVVASLLFLLVATVLRRRLCRLGGYSSAHCRIAAALGAAVWACHPLTVEVVCWPSAQPYALAGIFCLAALLALEWEWDTVLGPALYLAATLAKSVALPLPISVLALDLVAGRFRPRSFIYLRRRVAWVAVMMAALASAVSANRYGATSQADLLELPQLAQRARKAALTICFSISKALWPTELRPHYALELAPLLSWRDASDEVVLSVSACVLLGVLAASSCATCTAGRPPLVCSLLLHFVGFWLPVCGLVQHGMVQKGGDRYMYLPGLAAAPVAALGALLWVSASDGGRGAAAAARSRSEDNLPTPSLWATLTHERTWRWAVALFSAALVLRTEIVLSRSLVPLWRDDHTMLRHSIALDPTDWRMLDSYASLLINEGKKTEAEHYFLRALDAMPRPESGVKPLLSHAKTYLAIGRRAEACQMYAAGERLFGLNSSAAIANNRAICLLYGGVPERLAAGATFERALELAVFPDQRSSIVHNLKLYGQYRAADFRGSYQMKLIF